MDQMLPETKPATRLLLFGLYELGFQALQALAARDLTIVGLVTKPEEALDERPLARLAQSIGVPVLAPESPREARFLREVKRLAPDLIAVAGYHKILPTTLLKLPPNGVINLHGSLLPRYRGPCPWKWAIRNGESKSGATVQEMTAALDRGDILSQAEVPIDPADTGESLFLKICAVAGPLLAQTIADLEAGPLRRLPQDERLASYYGYPSDDDARIRWEWSAQRISNQVRGFCPRPGAWTQYGGKRLRVRRAQPAEGPLAQDPGMILGRSNDSLLVSTGRGNVLISGLSIDAESPSASSPPLWALGLIPGTFFDPFPSAELSRNNPSLL